MGHHKQWFVPKDNYFLDVIEAKKADWLVVWEKYDWDQNKERRENLFSIDLHPILKQLVLDNFWYILLPLEVTNLEDIYGGLVSPK
ncbi:MAG: hypothetical protein Fur0011_2300 [Candidatus Microgenomates bacterium]